MEEKRISPLKAIRLKCLDCSNGSSNEVKVCPITGCPLYPFRDGKNPFRVKKEYTPEQKAALASRLVKNNPINTGEKSENSLSGG